MHSAVDPFDASNLSRARRRRPILVGIASIVGAASAGGCLDRPLCTEDCRPKTTNVFVDQLRQTVVDKIDLLFMIDNSISMADKQEVLAVAVPDLVDRLVNPVCIANADGSVLPDAEQPPSPNDRCPGDSKREFRPIQDIHIGVISSSLGDFGATEAGDPVCPDAMNEEKNDRAHLLGGRPRALGLGIGSGPEAPDAFLDWDLGADPAQDLAGLREDFTSLVKEAGESGCGYEASLEAWYRFLVDPSPPLEIQIVPCEEGGGDCARPAGVDDALLAQRRAFLRPDSLVAVVMLSDENDCSIQSRNQLFYAARTSTRLPRASSACAASPNDPCCYPCTSAPPDGCGPDPICADPHYPDELDHPNLRCFNQKERFGVDFLYPVDRYVHALSEPRLCRGRASLEPEGCPDDQLVPNPLLEDANGLVRDPSLVYLAGIIGVPWQDIRQATDGDGNPLAATDLRFKTARQMADTGTWSIILGEPEEGIDPADPLMMESIDPRGGSNPVTGDPLVGPAGGYRANPINGHEWANPSRNDLQYACIFPLQRPRNCDDVFARDPDAGCDCLVDKRGFTVAEQQNPLCQAPDGSYGPNQVAAKAYPGLRHLNVLRDFGENSIVASICPQQLDDLTALNFGYRPAMRAIVDRLKEGLQGPCLPRELVVTEEGVPCSVVEARPRAAGAAGCGDLPGRRNPAPEVIEPAFKRLRELSRCGAEGQAACDSSGWVLCEIREAGPQCLEAESGDALGWCYVDPAKDLGDPALVEKCEPTKKRLLRFVAPEGENIPAKGATVLIACLGAPLLDEGE